MGRFFKVIFMAFGWIMIVVLIYHWSSTYYALSLAGVDVNSLDTRADDFRGFSYFFDRISQFPGFTTFYKGMLDWFRIAEIHYGQSETTKAIFDSEATLTVIVTAFKYMISPFVAIGLLVYNIALIIGWLLVWFI